MKKLIIIDNTEEILTPDHHRRKGFDRILTPYRDQGRLDFEYISYTVLNQDGDFTRLLNQNGENNDAIILSGSAFNLSNSIHRPMFKKVLEFIKIYDRPLLGICFGHQQLGLAHGFDIELMPEKYFDSEWWAATKCSTHIKIDTSVIPKFDLWEKEDLWVEFNHHDRIKPDDSGEFEKQFYLYSSTPGCPYQIIKDKSKPHIGVQFHPETEKPGAEEGMRDGTIFLQNFIEKYILDG